MPIESFSKSARVPCSCGGENGSCFRCDGTGLYLPALVLNVVSFLSAAVSAESLRALTEERRLAEARLQLTKRPISKTKAQSKKRQVDAGMTLKFLPNRALAWTTSSRAPTEARGPAGKRPQPEKLSEPRTSNTQQAAAGMLQQRRAPLTDKTTFTARLERQVPFTFGRCPDCNQVLPQGDIARHQKRLHPNRMVAVALWTPPMTTCPDCGGTVQANRLKAHREKSHGMPGKQVVDKNLSASKQKSSKSKGKAQATRSLDAAESSFDAPRDSTTTESSLRAESDLDATKGYPAAYRENGRFGSPPTHDGYDEESEV